MKRRVKSEDIITKYIKKIDDYEELTSKSLAMECGVSQATITRYVQSQGYKNFEEFRIYLINQEKIKKQKVNSFKNNKFKTLKYNLQNIDVSTNNQENDEIMAKMVRNQKVLVCSEIKYEKSVDVFLEKMNLLHGNVIMFKNENSLNYLLDKYNNECTIISIGNVDKSLYREDIQHFEIKYLNKPEKSTNKNKVNFHLQEEKNSFGESILLQKTLSFQIILDMLIEQYTRYALSEEEQKKVTEFLL